jgi:hypothetical protein
VILRAGLPRQHIRPATAPVSQRAIDIVHLVDDSGPDVARRVAEAIAKEAPYLGGAKAVDVTQTASASGSHERPRARPQARVSVLLVFANPRGTQPLRLGAEERALKQSIQLAAHRDRLEIEALHAATIDDLRRALIEKPRTSWLPHTRCAQRAAVPKGSLAWAARPVRTEAVCRTAPGGISAGRRARLLCAEAPRAAVSRW